MLPYNFGDPNKLQRMQIESSHSSCDLQMGLMTWIACTIIIGAETLDFRLQQIPESPGLYYEHLGEATLSSNVWKILSYVDLARVDENFETVRKHAQVHCRVLSNA
ncbi:hypothetical protein L798_11054 [Zootermopsis nevadensis]|uniref:Uncharacterized protein n=1 Tax=Zootermopsis nevadensis TaxID=136037 RepID=A0A067R034_ZOONE|nr:hypothetical protein L798_11054 [Zootermopsis nevadensis]